MIENKRMPERIIELSKKHELTPEQTREWFVLIAQAYTDGVHGIWSSVKWKKR